MERTELIRALRRMKAETGSLVCLGCGHEHNCSTQGCAIIRAAAEELEKMRWVPVTERLPEVGRKVLISWTANGGICFDTAFRLIDGWSATHWELSADVTHWMPLPEPPGGGKV